MPILRFFARQTAMTWAIILFTAAFRSSKMGATISLSRSTPRISCVRSFEPMLNPSNISENSSAWITLLGISHMT